MFPSVISTFPIVSATDRLNNPSHSTLENLQSSTIGQIQTFIGTNASAVGTLLYDVRSPNSNGGGHIQTANKGGTGQTTYTKGDILVATSASVLTKQSVGLDGTIFTADSTSPTGVRYVAKGIIAQSASIMTFGPNTVSETSILSVTVPANTLQTNKAVRTTVYISGIAENNASSILVQAIYGGTPVSSVLFRGVAGEALGDADSPAGELTYTLLANNSVSSQRGNMLINLNRPKLNIGAGSNSVLGVYSATTGTATIDSSSNQTLGVTVRCSTNADGNGIKVNGYLVEGIT